MSFHAFTGMEEAAAERCPRGREFISTSSRANLDNPMAPDPLNVLQVDFVLSCPNKTIRLRADRTLLSTVDVSFLPTHFIRATSTSIADYRCIPGHQYLKGMFDSGFMEGEAGQPTSAQEKKSDVSCTLILSRNGTSDTLPSFGHSAGQPLRCRLGQL